MRRHLDPEQPKTQQCTLDSASVFRFHDMENYLQAIDGRPVGVGGCPSEQLRNELFGQFGIAAQELAFGSLEMKPEGELVVFSPTNGAEQRDSGSQVEARCRVGGRCLCAPCSSQIERRDAQPLVDIAEKRGVAVERCRPLALPAFGRDWNPLIELIDDVKQMVGNLILCQASEEHPADRYMSCGSPAFLDQRIGRLLNTIMQELE